MRIRKKEDIKRHYEDKDIVDNYIDNRFLTPIGKFMHARQIEIANNFIKKNKNIKVILELAIGNARIASELYGFSKGFAFENSKEMIKAALKKLKEKNMLDKWSIIKQDIFNINEKSIAKYKDMFDLVYSFRFIRHLQYNDRKKVYDIVKKILKNGSLFMFDVPNFNVESEIRKRVGKEKFKIYDKLWKKEEIVKELESNGFRSVKFFNVINHVYIQSAISKIFNIPHLNIIGFFLIRLVDIKSKNPNEWVVVCQK